MFGDRFSSSTSCSRWVHETEPDRPDPSLTCCFLKVATHPVNANRSPSPAGQRQTERSGPRASILLLSSDGVNAENSSVYGYSRDTTPFLRQFSAEALVCQNAFANAAVTGASIAALLTGKLPTQTRLIYPPDILKGEDAYQHLPAILRNEGYRSIHLSIRHYADPYDLNLRHSFDSSNFRRLDEHQIPETLSRLAGLQGAYLFEILMDRLVGRLFHAFGWREMENPYRQVTETTKSYRRDAVLVKELLTFLEDSPSPFFAHLHLLGTHGPYFHPQRAHFSAGKTQDEEWMRDFYDDAIVDFDGYLKQIIDYLKRLGRLNETLVIITSDHGRSFATDVRIPLLFRFPGGEYSGTVTQNAQTIDIAPTVLNYLGIARPSWMTGESLIISQPEPDRPIFSAFPLTVGRTRKKTGLVANPAAMEPPFYSLRAVGMIHCQKWYRLELLHPRLFVSQIDGHTAPCGDPEQRKFDEAADMMVDHLSDNGYDTSSIFRFGAVKAPSGFSEAGLPAIPFSLKDTHPALLEDTSIGVSLVNLASLESELVAVGRDGKGRVRYATHLGPLSKKTFMTHELAGPKSKQDFLQIQSSGDDLHALCMVADESLRRLERIGGDLIPLKEFYLPVARSEHEEITVVFLFNPDLQESAQVVLNLMGRQGRILKQSRLLLPPRETHLGTLGQIFGAGLRIREGYLRVQSTHDLQAFEVVASQTALSALPAQKTLSGARVWVPHFLIDREGRSTQLRLINSGKATFRVMVRVADYQAHTLRMIPLVHCTRAAPSPGPARRPVGTNVLKAVTGGLSGNRSRARGRRWRSGGDRRSHMESFRCNSLLRQRRGSPEDSLPACFPVSGERILNPFGDPEPDCGASGNHGPSLRGGWSALREKAYSGRWQWRFRYSVRSRLFWKPAQRTGRAHGRLQQSPCYGIRLHRESGSPGQHRWVHSALNGALKPREV